MSTKAISTEAPAAAKPKTTAGKKAAADDGEVSS